MYGLTIAITCAVVLASQRPADGSFTRVAHSRPFTLLECSASFFAGEVEQFGKASGYTVGKAFGFSICFIFIPTFFDTLDISCKQS